MFDKFRFRSEANEIMDDLSTRGDVVSTTLKELDVINQYLGGNRIVLKALEKLFKENRGQSFSIVDLGCGSGTLLKLISKLADKYGVNVSLIGVDANAFIIGYANANTSEYPNIRFLQMDVLNKDFFDHTYDIVICSLFCHHLKNEQFQRLLEGLTRITKNFIIISDLHRHWLAYYSISSLTYLFSNSAMVKYDAGLSVLKAFKKDEIKSILKNAGISKYSICWKWAFRYEVIINCS